MAAIWTAETQVGQFPTCRVTVGSTGLDCSRWHKPPSDLGWTTAAPPDVTLSEAGGLSTCTYSWGPRPLLYPGWERFHLLTSVPILGPALVPSLNMPLCLGRGAGFPTSLLSKGALGVLAGSRQADARPCSALSAAALQYEDSVHKALLESCKGHTHVSVFYHRVVSTSNW